MTTPHALPDVPICFGAPFLSVLFLNKLLMHTSLTNLHFVFSPDALPTSPTTNTRLCRASWQVEIGSRGFLPDR